MRVLPSLLQPLIMEVVMSNCINIYNSRVSLGPNELDIPKFKAQVEKSMKINRSEDIPEDDPETYIFWWYMSRNVEFNNRVVIDFGNCRSSHTWRDFRHTINTLNKYMKKSWLHTFELEDEGMLHYDSYDIDLSQPADF
jgi:hypothetical protein